jgi:hypothetical protein
MNTDTQPPTPPPVAPPGADADRGWRSKTLAEIMAEQGITGPQDLDALIGAGEDLWADDAEFEQFLAYVHQSRREGR